MITERIKTIDGALFEIFENQIFKNITTQKKVGAQIKCFVITNNFTLILH